MDLALTIAGLNEAAQIAELRNKVARDLEDRYGEGQWGFQTTEKWVKHSMKAKSKIFVAKNNNEIVGSLCLQTNKPWAIDISYFTKVAQPVYLVDMAVEPVWQQKGIGSFMLQEIISYARSWPAQAIRLDAYDSEAGAGEFYRKCGYSERGHVVYRGNPLIYFELLL